MNTGSSIPRDQFIALAGLLPAACFLMDAEGRYLWVNEMWSLSHSPGSGIAPGTDRAAVHGHAVAEEMAVADTEVLAGREAIRVDKVRVRTTSGHRRLVTGVKLPVLLPDGACGVGGVFLDVTDLEEAREAAATAHARAESAEQQFRLFMDHAPVGVALYDEKRRFRYANHAITNNWGMSVRQLLDGSYDLRGFATPADELRVREEEDRAVLREGRLVGFDRLMTTPGGPVRINGYKFPVPQHDGSTLIGVVSLDISDRLAALSRAEAAERRFHLFMEHSPAAAALVGVDGVALWANRTFAELVGTTVEQLIGSRAQDLGITGERAAVIDAENERMLATGRPVPLEVLFTATGGERAVAGYKFPVPAPDKGWSVGMVAVETGHLMEALRRAEAAEARFTTFAENTPAVAMITDADGRYTWVNRAYEQVFGRTREHVIGRALAEVDSPEVAASISAEDEEVLASGTARLVTFTARNADGGKIHALGYRFPHAGTGDSLAVGGVFLDLTRQRAAERLSAESEQRYRALFDHAHVAIALFSTTGVLTEANPAYARLFDSTAMLLRGVEMRSLLVGDDRERAEQHWQELLTGKRRSFTADFLCRRQTGAPFSARHTCSLAGTADSATHVVAVVELLAAKAATAPAVLSEGELEVLAGLASGLTITEVADALTISPRGVDYRIARVKQKLGLERTSLAGVVAAAYHHGAFAAGKWPPQPAPR